MNIIEVALEKRGLEKEEKDTQWRVTRQIHAIPLFDFEEVVESILSELFAWEWDPPLKVWNVSQTNQSQWTIYFK